jgi:hypothetical protein
MTKLFNLVNLIKTRIVEDNNATSDKPLSYKLNMHGYVFEKYVVEEKKHRSYSFALYKNAEGKEAFAKIWTGHNKNFDYYSLLNEIHVYKTLSELSITSSIRTPSLIDCELADTRLTLLLEYINFRPHEIYDVQNQVEQFRSVFAYLEKLTKSKDVFVKNGISLRPTYVYAMFFPVLLLKVAIKYPKLISKLGYALKLFIRGSARLLTAKTDCFCHRSVELQNILTADNSIYLIDFQLAVLSHKYLDYVQTLLFMWHNKPLCQELYNQIIFPNLTLPAEFNAFRALCIYNAVYHLAEGDNTYSGSQEFLDCLLGLKFNKLMELHK